MATKNKVLVYIKNSANTIPKQAHFTQSFLDAVECVGHHAYLYAALEDNKLLISKTKWLEGQTALCMKRPSFCPMHNISQKQIAELPESIRSRGVDVGCATILESCDGKVLLTRGALHLHTFPGIWVPPGGHVELGETLHEAGLRELQEETGLKISASQCQNNTIPLLALWESSYPSRLAAGLPKRHHVVVYLHAKLIEPFTSQLLQGQVKLDPGEVKSCSWFDRNLVETILRYSNEESESVCEVPEGLPRQFSLIEVDETGTHSAAEQDTSVLFNKDPGRSKDVERISTGTKFSLREWLQATGSSAVKLNV